jgi:hypothetical protein
MTALALGCSHTAGVGINTADCYVSVLSNMLDTPIINQGVAGGNAGHVQSNLVQALKLAQSLDFVIAQWPNPFRRTTWYNNKSRNENIHFPGTAFEQLLRDGEQNFYQPWIDSIIVCNLLCKATAIPIVNIMIEDVPEKYHDMLAVEKIVLHVDRKLPNETWLMDNKASDNLHHSAICHKQWADRLYRLMSDPILKSKVLK